MHSLSLRIGEPAVDLDGCANPREQRAVQILRQDIRIREERQDLRRVGALVRDDDGFEGWVVPDVPYICPLA